MNQTTRKEGGNEVILSKSNKIMILCFSILVLILPYILRFSIGNISPISKNHAYFLSVFPMNASPLNIFHVPILNTVYSQGYIYAGISLALSIASLFLLYKIFRKITLGETHIFIMIIIIILSPGFIYLALTPSYHSIIFFLISLATYLIISEYLFVNVAGYILLLPIVYFGRFAVIPIFVLAIYLFYSRKRVAANLFFIMLFSLVYITSPPEKIFSPDSYIISLFSDFGGGTGFSLSLLILGIVGMFSVAGNKIKNVSLAVASIALIALSFNDIHYMIYAVPLLSFFASSVICSILERRWELGVIKRATLLIIVCTFIFSPVAYAKRVSFEEPSQEMLNSLSKLKYLEEGRIIAPGEDRYMVEYYGGRKELLLMEHLPDEIKNGRDLRKWRWYLRDNDLRYIWLTPQIKEEIWGNEHEGLLYLINNYGGFEKIDSRGGYELWKLR